MANSKSTTRRRNNHNSQLDAMKDVIVYTAAQIIATSPTDISLMPLTRSQRLQLGQLAATTGAPAHQWVRRAINNFLEDEAPVWMEKALEA